jgi:hypothetical protein
VDWLRAVDNYCERTDASYWSEPLNALSNAAFITAAVFSWWMLRGKRDRGARVLAATLFAIGLGSYLFHTHAQVWAALADVLPILIFVLVYVYLATIRFFAFRPWVGLAAAAVYLPLSVALSNSVVAILGPLNGSTGYMPLVLLIAAYAASLWPASPKTARGLVLGAALLILSLTARTLDSVTCPIWPAGTHFVWHCLNAVMLGWMILVLAAHTPAPALARRLPRE